MPENYDKKPVATEDVNPFARFHAEQPSLDNDNPFARFHGQQPKEQGRTALGTIKDTAITAAKGVVGLGEAAAGLTNLATFGGAGKVLDKVGYDPKATQDFLSDKYSDPQKEANRKVEEATGFIGTGKAMLQNPSTIYHGIVETALPMLGGGAAARGLLQGAAKYAPKLAAKTWAGVAAGATGEGLVSAGQQAEQIRQETPGKTLSAKQAGLAVAAGAGTAAFGFAGGALAKKLGFADIDEWMANGASNSAKKVGFKGLVKRVVGGGISEGVFEEMPQSAQETILYNAAMDKPLLEGVPESMAQGLVLGGIMGAGANLLPNRHALSTLPPPRDLERTTLPGMTGMEVSQPGTMGDIEAGIQQEDSLRHNQFRNTQGQRQAWTGNTGEERNGGPEIIDSNIDDALTNLYEPELPGMVQEEQFQTQAEDTVINPAEDIFSEQEQEAQRYNQFKNSQNERRRLMLEDEQRQSMIAPKVDESPYARPRSRAERQTRAAMESQYDNSYNLEGAPDVDYISDQDAARFEKETLDRRKSKQWLEGNQKFRQQEQEDQNLIADPAIPADIKINARKQAESIVNSDPVYGHLQEAKKRGGLDLAAFKQDYDEVSVAAIQRRYPGVFSNSGAIKPDDFAAEMGYQSLDDMVQTFTHARTKKELQAKIVRELHGEWQDAESAMQADNAREGRKAWPRTTKPELKQPKTSYPAKEQDVQETIQAIQRYPESADEMIDHWSFSPEQKARLIAARREIENARQAETEATQDLDGRILENEAAGAQEAELSGDGSPDGDIRVSPGEVGKTYPTSSEPVSWTMKRKQERAKRLQKEFDSENDEIKRRNIGKSLSGAIESLQEQSDLERDLNRRAKALGLPQHQEVSNDFVQSATNPQPIQTTPQTNPTDDPQAAAGVVSTGAQSDAATAAGQGEPSEVTQSAAQGKKANVAAIRKAGGLFSSDNPGGGWLEHEQKRAKGKDGELGLRHGAVTAQVRKVMLRVSDIKKLKGVEGEHLRLSHKDQRVKDIAQSIKDNGYDPKEPVFINVGFDGTALINEGNHRVRAAALADIDYIPVEIAYFAGGENADGPMSLEHVSSTAIPQNTPDKVSRTMQETPSPPAASGQATATASEKAGVGGGVAAPFDSAAYDKEWKRKIAESRDSGVKHADSLPFGVEAMRGVRIKHVITGEVGVITTVSSDNRVYVLWESYPQAESMVGSEAFISRQELAEHVITDRPGVKLNQKTRQYQILKAVKQTSEQKQPVAEKEEGADDISEALTRKGKSNEQETNNVLGKLRNSAAQDGKEKLAGSDTNKEASGTPTQTNGKTTVSTLKSQLQKAANNPNKKIADLAKFLQAFIPASKLNLPVNIDPQAKTASYNVTKNIITLTDTSEGGSTLHEVTHGITVREMEKSPRLKRRVTHLMKITRAEVVRLGLISKEKMADIESLGGSHGFKNRFPAGTLSGVEQIAYGLLNEREFLSQAFSSKEFQDILKSIKVEQKGWVKTAWDALVEAVMRGIGIPLAKHTAFAEVMSLTAELAQVNLDETVGEFAQPVSEGLDMAIKKITDNPNFVKWFGDSKVVDEDGEPLVVYHGTISNFSVFDVSGQSGLHPTAKLGAFFSDRKDVADTFGNIVGQYYLSITNPLVISASDFFEEFSREQVSVDQNIKDDEELDSFIEFYVDNLKYTAESGGHDGILIKAAEKGDIHKKHLNKNTGNWFELNGNTYVVFRPNQIKSIFNNGNFSTESDDISEALATTVTEEDYAQIKKNSRNMKVAAKRGIVSFGRQVSAGADKYLGSISTRLRSISPKIEAKVRKLDFDIGTKHSADIKNVMGMLEKGKKMTRGDYAEWDYARKNGDVAKINELTARYDMQEEYAIYRETMDRIRAEANDVGLSVGFIENYSPRIIKDPEGFLNELGRGNDWPVISQALAKKAKDLGISVSEMTEEMKADLVSNMLLGGGFGLSGPSGAKERKIKIIPPHLNKYYMASDAALMNYLYSMRKSIEYRRFFGRVPERISKAKSGMHRAMARLREEEAKDQPNNEKMQEINGLIGEYRDILDRYKYQRDYSDNIAAYVLELYADGDISPEQERTLVDILKARFHESGTRGIVQAYKNLSYIDTMGSVISAVTQIGDLAWSAYENGLAPTLKHAYRSAVKESRITKEDVGIVRIAQEFADSDTLSNAVAKVFKYVGLEKMDSIGKESMLNATLENYEKQAQNSPDELAKKIKAIFKGETSSVISDLQNKEITENVKLLVFSKLLDYQPAALSEMPEQYLKAGNGRIFYMLKSYTLKQFDVYRREVYQKLKTGDRQEKLQAMRNLAMLSMFLVLANAGADELKDLILGRETDLSDRLVDNALRLFGVSKFVTWKARTEGTGSALAKQILPPFKFIDSITKDVITAGDGKGVYSFQSVPIVGKLAYWHLGRGMKSREELWDRRLAKERGRLNDIQERVEKSPDLKVKYHDDLMKLRRLNRLQAWANKRRKVINRLKEREERGFDVKDRILSISDMRTNRIEEFLSS